MDNRDVRAHILKEFYDQEMRDEYRGTDPGEFAQRLGVPKRQVEVALKYLVDMGLIKGEYVASTDVPVTMGIAALGLDLVDDPKNSDGLYEINQQIIQVTGPVYGQIAQAQAGSEVTQTRAIGNFVHLEQLVDSHHEIGASEREALKQCLREIHDELEHEQISTSRLGKLLEQAKQYSWLYPLIIEMIMKTLKTVITGQSG